MSDVSSVSEYECLSGLLNDLVSNGFDISLDQRIRVISVLLAFRLRRGSSCSDRRLRYLLGPVLCRSAEEQEIFGRIMGHWFPGRLESQDGESTDANRTDDQEWRSLLSERRAFEAEAARRLRARRLRDLRQQLRVVIPMLIVFFVLSIGIQRILLEFALPQPSGTEISVSPTATVNTRIDQEGPSSFQNKRSAVVSWFASVANTLGPFTTVFLMIPMALLALAIASSRKLISAYARQTRVRPRDEMRRLLSGDRQQAEFVKPGFFRDIQPMRRSVDLPSSELDLERTIEATVASGGYFTPIFSYQRASPEYLLLIDRQGSEDHFARYSLTLAYALASAGVYTTTYFFRQDPRRIVVQSGHQYLDLADLQQRHQFARLIIFSDGAGLYDFATADLQPWTSTFADWTKAVLLTPKEPLSWGRLEFLIETQLNVPVLPVSEAGLSAAAIIFDNDTVAATVTRPIALDRFSDPASLSSFLAVGTWQWVDDIEPSATHIDRLEKQLLIGLSEDAVDLLRAIAVYPKIYWSLTIYIASHLFSTGDAALSAELQLRELLRLPWFTFGHMPNWLRRRLVEGMSTDLRNRVHHLLENLLVSVTSRDPKNLAMSFGLSKAQSPEEELNRFDREELHDDHILIDFMTRREAKAEDFQIRSRVARALGIARLGSGMKSLFSRSALKEMGVAAKEVRELVPSHAFAHIRVGSLVSTFGMEAYTAENICDSEGNMIECPFTLYLVRLRRSDSLYLIDEASLDTNARITRLFVRFSIVSLLVFTSAVVAFHIWFIALPTIGVAVASLCFLIYFPFVVFWILLRRPYSRALKEFPQIRPPFNW